METGVPFHLHTKESHSEGVLLTRFHNFGVLLTPNSEEDGRYAPQVRRIIVIFITLKID